MADNIIHPRADAISPAAHHSDEFHFGGRTGALPPTPLGRAAYHGLTGELVDTVLPHTEADAAALVTTFLVHFGNCAGRSPYFLVGGTKHRTNEYLVLAGPTARGRKGMAQDVIEAQFQFIDPDWFLSSVSSGLSSGEGLVAALGELSSGADDQDELGDVGRRLMAIQEEFSAVIKLCNRPGNILSEIVRQGHGSKPLRVMNKNAPVRVTNPHLSIIGHITREETLSVLTSVESANGFGNRFLWAAVKRSKELPDGGALDDAALRPLRERIRDRIDFAHHVGLMLRIPAANEIWRDVYHQLSEGVPGLYGSMTARATAHVLRLSMIYALLDRLDFIMPEHLLAALEVWRFCDESVRFIFGDRLGDPVADRILDALRAVGGAGMTRSEISGAFHRNTPAAAIEASLQLLIDNGLATFRHEPTEGRVAQRWFAIEFDPGRR